MTFYGYVHDANKTYFVSKKLTDEYASKKIPAIYLSRQI
jgi:hypothetical protein